MFEEYEELLRRARHMEIDIDTLGRRLQDHINQNQCDEALKSMHKVVDHLHSISVGSEVKRTE